jgi:integrase
VHASVLRQFFDWQVDEDLVDSRRSPFPRLFKIPDSHREVQFPTTGQVLEARRAINKKRGHRRLERIAALELLVGGGLRISELLQIRMSHFDQQTKTLVLDPDTMDIKRGHGRHTHLPPQAVEAMTNFIGQLWKRKGKKGGKSKADPLLFSLTVSGLEYILRVQGLTPHACRRFWCSAMYYKNMEAGTNDIEWVREHSGHSNIQTTGLYTRQIPGMTDETWEQIYGRKDTHGQETSL